MTTADVSTPSRLPGALSRAGVVAGAGALLFAIVLSPFRLCASALLLGLPCPGCGLSRAGTALLHGDVTHALAFHPLSIIIVPLSVAFGVSQSVRYVRVGRSWSEKPTPRSVEVLAGVLLVALVAVWILRFMGYFGGPVPV